MRPLPKKGEIYRNPNSGKRWELMQNSQIENGYVTLPIKNLATGERYPWHTMLIDKWNNSKWILEENFLDGEET